MSPVADLWDEIAAFEPLCRAARRAAAGKRRVRSIARWLAELEPNVLRLERELRAGVWRPGRPTTFTIHDPKTRTITAAPFEDRVVHHALMDRLEPLFEERMIEASFACRKGKGTHAALRRARRLVRRHERFLKLDVRRCFDSLDHDVALDSMRAVVSDERVLALCERIVRSGGESGRGLPIGNLTSQWLANLILNRLDHFVTGELRVPGYLRYMDDFVLFSDSATELRRAQRDVAAFLATRLRLELKERATIHAPASQGLPFLGWRIYRGTTRLRPANLRRMRARLRHRAWEHRSGRIGEERFHAAVRSAMEHLRHGNTLSLRRGWIEDLRARAPERRSLEVFERGRAIGAAHRVNRGGSFNDTAVNARSANRNDTTPSNADNDLGVRPAKAPHRQTASEIDPRIGSGRPSP